MKCSQCNGQFDPNNDPKVGICFVQKQIEDDAGKFKHGKNDKIQRFFFRKYVFSQHTRIYFCTCLTYN